MIKIIIVLTVILLFLWIAVEYKRNFKLKLNLYNEAIMFIDSFSSQLSFNKMSLIEFIKKEECNSKERFLGYIKNFLITEKFSDLYYLSDVECSELKEFIKSLGKYDVFETEKILKIYRDKFETKKEYLLIYYKEHIEPIYKIIIILGIAISILII